VLAGRTKESRPPRAWGADASGGCEGPDGPGTSVTTSRPVMRSEMSTDTKDEDRPSGELVQRARAVLGWKAVARSGAATRPSRWGLSPIRPSIAPGPKRARELALTLARSEVGRRSFPVRMMHLPGSMTVPAGDRGGDGPLRLLRCPSPSATCFGVSKPNPGRTPLIADELQDGLALEPVVPHELNYRGRGNGVPLRLLAHRVRAVEPAPGTRLAAVDPVPRDGREEFLLAKRHPVGPRDGAHRSPRPTG